MSERIQSFDHGGVLQQILGLLRFFDIFLSAFDAHFRFNRLHQIYFQLQISALKCHFELIL